ncbi:MAG TPA: carboxypeptidase regulatory-like domain-containing protein [Bryobacteraceae bacterium]|jgi:hypothetical protein|nr:carboxypeptidase regulatory-like domain-containing protein [Bryobacteraceae bacterium]
MRSRSLALFALFLLFAGSFTLLNAQEVAATLTGTITDPTGAVVQGAEITIHNNDTNTDVRTLTTSGSGAYTATNLPPGNYTVNVKASGFRVNSISNVVLHVAELRTLNAQLEPGQVTETVNVASTTTPVQTSSAAQAATITGTQVRELQLNNRNFEQLVTLQPGVVSGLPDIINFGISNTSSVSVNGARTGANNWTVDGADINDSGSNLTLLNVPSVDAIQEFTMQRSTYDAQYGRSGGGQVLVATKSGTSQFHGDAYEFFRNDILNANEFFANTAGRPKAPLRYNDFGFTIGGPLFIPKVYSRSASKTFFFWSEEWRKTGQPSTNTALLPATGELNGSFPGVQLNPASAPAGCITNTPAGGQINPACFSQNAKAYIANIYSKFTANGPSNEYISTVNSKQNYRQDIVRVDQNITDRVHLFGRFMQDDVPTTEPGGLFAGNPLPGISSTATDAPGRNVVGNLTYTISPSVVNEVAYAYSWGAINSSITGSITSPDFVKSLTNNFPYTDPYNRVPGITITGVTGVAIPVSPYHERNIDQNVYDNLSISHGNHSIRTGISVQWMEKTENAVNGTNGSFSFRNAYGNPAFANFLLGDASQFTQANRDIIPDLHYVNIEAFVQDDWKIRPNLTLNLGVRYSYFPSPTDSNNVLDNFDPAVFNPAAAPLINPVTGQFVAGQGVVPATYVNGIIFPKSSCAAVQKTAPVTCSPYGNLVNPNSNNNWGPRAGFAWDPRGNGKTSIRGGYGIYYDRSLNGIWEQNAFANPPLVQSALILNTKFDNPLGGTTSTPLGPTPPHATGNPTFKVPSYQGWNFSVQQQIASNTVLEVAYVGGVGRHLLGEYDPEQPTLGVRFANPTVQVNAIRPYVGYSDFTDIAPLFNSNYNSLQVSMNRHVTNQLTIGLAYTWSRNLADNAADRGAPVNDTYNFYQSYGPPGINTPHVFKASYVWDLPIFKSQQGFFGHVLGGWELSGITTFQSGSSFTITQSNDPFNSDDWGTGAGLFPGGIGIDPSSIAPRADVVPRQSISGPGTVAQYFNTAAFTDAIGHFGTASQGVLLGPGIENWDLSGIKNIKFTERFNLQFRAEFFNAFNHESFSTVSSNVDSSNFGRITGGHLPRNIQLGLKLNF